MSVRKRRVPGASGGAATRDGKGTLAGVLLGSCSWCLKNGRGIGKLLGVSISEITGSGSDWFE